MLLGDSNPTYDTACADSVGFKLCSDSAVTLSDPDISSCMIPRIPWWVSSSTSSGSNYNGGAHETFSGESPPRSPWNSSSCLLYLWRMAAQPPATLPLSTLPLIAPHRFRPPPNDCAAPATQHKRRSTGPPATCSISTSRRGLPQLRQIRHAFRRRSHSPARTDRNQVIPCLPAAGLHQGGGRQTQADCVRLDGIAVACPSQAMSRWTTCDCTCKFLASWPLRVTFRAGHEALVVRITGIEEGLQEVMTDVTSISHDLNARITPAEEGMVNFRGAVNTRTSRFTFLPILVSWQTQ